MSSTTGSEFEWLTSEELIKVVYNLSSYHKKYVELFGECLDESAASDEEIKEYGRGERSRQIIADLLNDVEPPKRVPTAGRRASRPS